jgi:YidC/Oxa1 family membrane protein insertase
MDRNLLIAVVLSVLVVVGYQEYLRVYYPQKPKPAASPTLAPETKTTAAPRADGAAAPPIPELADEPTAPTTAAAPDVAVETDVFLAKLSSRGGRLVSFQLKNYRTAIDPQSQPLEMVNPGADLPLGVVLRGEQAKSDREVAYEPSTRDLRLTGDQEGEVAFRGTLPDGGTIEKRLRFRGARYDFEVALDVGEAATAREAGLAWANKQAPPSQDQHWVGAEALIDKKLVYLEPEQLTEGAIYPNPRDPSAANAAVQWAGYADSYFLSAIAPNVETSARAWLKLQQDTVTTEVLVPIAAVQQDAPEYTVYVGPKDLEHLTPAARQLHRALDLGWFSLLAELLLRVLKFFHRFTGNYGLDIILLTVLIKALFIPLTHKSFASMQAMQKVQPEMKKLQERFKDDREALNREMMELYRRHKVNPLGGCLPMLLQMPVFIGLYNALFYAVELRHAPFALWINDLSSPDRLPAIPAAPIAEMFGVDIRIPVLTLLMGASMLVQQRMTPAMGDPAQQRMMMFMPVIFTVMFVSFPAGLVLYWLVNNVLTIAQQRFMMQRAPKS